MDHPENQICQHVILSNNAYNAILSQVKDKDPVETGGILLGHILEGGFWIVVESISPGWKAIHNEAYFEYDTEFVNYLANEIAIRYETPPQLLGLWHRHPGGFDIFSGTDMITNHRYAERNPQYGIISGIVNCDPGFRLQMYHVDIRNNVNRIEYSVDNEYEENLIPEDYLRLAFSKRSDGIIFPKKNNPQKPPIQQNNFLKTSTTKSDADNNAIADNNTSSITSTGQITEDNHESTKLIDFPLSFDNGDREIMSKRKRSNLSSILHRIFLLFRITNILL